MHASYVRIKLINKREAQKTDIVANARVKLQWDFASCGRAGNVEPQLSRCPGHGARAERGTLSEGVERCGEETGRPCVCTKEDPLAGVARGILWI